jgi:hypothetical protein
MKSTLTILIFAFLLQNVTAQNQEFKAPDYTSLKSIIIDKNSEYYYPKLLERYNDSDTTLTLQDFSILYYGFLFTDSYAPYGHSDYIDSLKPILDRDTLYVSDYKMIIRYESLILNEFPFNLRDLNILSYCYAQIGDSLASDLTYFKLDMLINTILSTGDGKKEESGWHVISVSHEYDILGVLGFRFGGSQSLTSGGCDYLEVQANEYNIPGFYFDVNKMLDKESELLRQ